MKEPAPIQGAGIHPRSDTWLIAGLFSIVTIGAFEATAVITALPTVTDEFHGDSLYGLTIAVNLLANIIVIVASAIAADRFGPGRPFILCATVFVAGLLVSGAAPSMAIVVLGRILQGSGVGGFITLAYVAVSRGIREDRQQTALAAMSAGWVLPSLVAPALAGWITERFGWRWVFYGIVPIVAVLGAFVAPMLLKLPAAANRGQPAPTGDDASGDHGPGGHGPGDHGPGDHIDGNPSDRRRVLAAVRLALGLGVGLWGLTLDRWQVVAPLALGGGAVALSGSRLLYPAGVARARPGLPAVFSVRLVSTMAFIGVESFLPLAADRIHGVGPIAQGMVIIGAAVTWTIGQAFAARWRSSGRVDDAQLVRTGFVAMAVGIASSMVILRPGVPLAVAFCTWSVTGFGMGMLVGPTTVRALSLAGDGQDGIVSSQISLSDSVGFAMMGGIGGAMVALADRDVFSLRTAILLNAVISATLAVLGIAISRRVLTPDEAASTRRSRRSTAGQSGST